MPSFPEINKITEFTMKPNQVPQVVNFESPYDQNVTYGINLNQKSFNITWDFLTFDEVDDIVEFLDGLNWGRFQLTDMVDREWNLRCDPQNPYSVSYKNTYGSITGGFIQDFNYVPA
jgi:phage-related protein